LHSNRQKHSLIAINMGFEQCLDLISHSHGS
jgi:hypothetical protein